MTTETYDAQYYDTHLGPIPYDRDQVLLQNHFRTAAAAIVELLKPKRALDVGCAKGFLVEHLRDLGVEAFGLDGSEYALSEVREDVKPYCRRGSALEPLGEHWDLITCIEVAEHLAESDAARLVENLCTHADTVLFSSTPEDFAESTHLNVQPAAWWKELFAQNGFYPDLRFEPRVITPQALLFRRVVRPVRVAVFSKEKAEWAVVRLRVLDPLKELAKQGRVHVTFVSPYATTIDVEGLLAADLFIVGREFADKEFSEEITQVARLLGKPIVFELDDLLTKVPRTNPVWSYCLKIAPDMEEMVRRADWVTVSTDALKEELAEIDPTVRDRTVVLRNIVNPEIWGNTFPERPLAGRETSERAPKQAGEPLPPLVVGWFGSPTHLEDLQVVAEAIRYVARKYEGRVEFQFFGYMPEEFQDIPGVRLARGPQVDVVKHAQGVRAAHIDVAIAPLTDHPFNHSKSDLKWLEYSICGIPGIYSNVTPYAGSITHGETGLLSENTTASWVAALELLIRDEALRQRIAQAAFREVRGSLCLDRGAMAWDDAYRTFLAGGARLPAELPDETGMARAAALLFKFQARLLGKRGRIVEAAHSFEAALELDAELAGDAVAYARRMVTAGHLAAALHLTTVAAAKNPDDPDPLLALAKILRALNDPVAAEPVFEIAAAKHAADPDIAREHAEHLVATGRSGAVVRRLEPAVAASAADAVVLAERLLQLGLAREALELVEHAAACHGSAEFAPLKTSLARFVAALPGAKPQSSGLLRVAVYSADPLSGARVSRRLRAPLRVLERARRIEVAWSDGRACADAVDRADVVVIQRAFATPRLCDPIVKRARARGASIVFEIDDLFFTGLDASDDAVALREGVLRLLREADAVTVPTEAMKDALIGHAPEAYERIHVLPTRLDVEIWSSVARWPDPAGRPLTVGLFHGHAAAEDVRKIVHTLSPLMRTSRGAMLLSQWTPEVDPGAPLASGKSVGAASPIYLEYAHKLQRRPVDIALLPVSDDPALRVKGDATFLELAACRIPVIFSALEPFSRSVVPGDTGFLLSGDADAWSDAVRQLAASPQIRRQVAERAWTAVLSSCTVQQHAAAWLSVYAKVARGQKARERATVGAQ